MHHFYHSWRHKTFDPDLKNSVDFDPLHSTHHQRFRFYRGRMMYCHGPSRILWFTVGAFAATWYHREYTRGQYTRGEFRGWGPCGNRRIEEWRAERAAEPAPREQRPANDVVQQKNETIAERSWRSASLPSFEDEEVRRKWDEKTRKAQETVRLLPNFRPIWNSNREILKSRLRACPSLHSTEFWLLRNPSKPYVASAFLSASAVNLQRLRFD